MVNRVSSLRKKSDFLELKLNGKLVRLSPWLMISYLNNNLGQTRLGITIPKKVGNAVIRNRVRRRLKTFFQIHTIDKAMDINLIVRPKSETFYKELSYNDVEKVLSKFFK